MPLYEYECRECGNVSEVLQKIADPPLTVCSECDGELKKLISSPAIQFRGSGFYINDYKKSGSGSSESSKSDSGAGEKKATDSGSGEKKPTTAGSSSEK